MADTVLEGHSIKVSTKYIVCIPAAGLSNRNPHPPREIIACQMEATKLSAIYAGVKVYYLSLYCHFIISVVPFYA